MFTFDSATGIGDAVFDSGLCVRPCIVFVFAMEILPPLNFGDTIGMGLNVMLLFTSVTGGVFDAEGTTTLRAVTVSALFLLIAATASLVGSFDFVLDGIGFRIIAATG